MDNNFVNIDDLVRQRLGGGEEQERSGAWLQMRDLLDKEMPQKRAGFIYWRRMLSAVAVLLLIASISVGGYELSASRSSNKTENTDVALTATPARAANTPAKNNEVSNAQLSLNGVADNKQPNNDKQDNKNKQDNKKLIAANNNQPKNKQHNQPAADRNTQNTPNSTETNKQQLPVADIAARSGKTDNAPVAKKVPASNVAGKNETSNAIAGVAAVERNKATAPAHTAAVAKVDRQPENVPGSDNKIPKTATRTTSSGKSAGNEMADVSKETTSKPAAEKIKEKKVKEEKMEALALSSHLTSVSSPKISTVSVPGAAETTVNTTGIKASNKKAVVSSSTVVAKKKNIAAIGNDKVVASKESVTKSGKTASDKVVNATPASTDKNTKIAAVNSPKPGTPATSIPAATVDNAAMKAAYALNTKKGKKVIQKLVLYEHYIKTNPSDEHYNLDTISMETLTEELGGEDNPYIPCAKKSAAREVPNNSTNNNGSGNEVASATTSADPQILLGASASANGKPAMGTKENTTSKQSAGAGALEGLSEAFNDVKYKVGRVQFAPGLTAGINGTFFGPSSFKGFQFGITGDFIFGNDWSLATELKYFQRVNNTYALSDNSYSYTPNPNGGGYNMEQTTNTYSFSTLHSVEMPLVLGYTNGKFKFFIGGNLVYSFSINEGSLQTQTITSTAINGNNTSPKIDPVTDFNSRFGIGCLFGISYKIVPNVSLDLRNVMTLWDNANSPGAKYVSDQLYKSPSIQLSLGYRLGGKKAKD